VIRLITVNFGLITNV